MTLEAWGRMEVVINWTELDDGGEDYRWHEEWCVYAYLHPDDDELLYLGKADRSTTWKRLHGPHKDRVFNDIADEFDVGPGELGVLHGDPELPPGRHRTSALLADIESLLIMHLQPWGNIQSKGRRIARPGLNVHCVGDWPFEHRKFHDLA